MVEHQITKLKETGIYYVIGGGKAVAMAITLPEFLICVMVLHMTMTGFHQVSLKSL